MSETILKPLTSNNAQNPYPDEMMLDLYNTDGVKNNIEHHEKTSQKNSKKTKDDQEKDEETTAILLEQNSSLPLPTMTETEIPVPVSESASSQAVKATTVSTSSSSSDGNGAIWGILGGLAGLGAIAGLAGGSKGGKSSGEPQTQHVPISPNPTPTITPTPPAPPVPEKTTIKIHYSDLKSDVYAGQTDVKFDYAPVRYVAKKISVSEEFIQTQYLKKFGANKITQNIEQAYARDSDNDGVVDFNDRNPNAWDVSERDLRFFATIAYEEPETLIKAFNGDDPNAIKLINKSDNFAGNANINELTQTWEVLEAKGLSTGLDYAVYGTDKKSDGGYENVVVAFRGTKGIKDIISDIGVGVGKLIDEVKYFDKLANDIMAKYKPSNVYTTGHSLGGYLAQYFASHTMQQNAERKEAFKHSAIFNPAKLTTNQNGVLDKAYEMYQEKSWVNDADINYSKISTMSTSYVIDGDVVTYGGVPAKYIATGVGLTAAGVALSAVPFIGWFFGAVAVISAATTATGVVFDGLGTYPNTTILTGFSGDSVDKHFKHNFYLENSQSKFHFSNGYRMDNPYYAKKYDEDNDGLKDYDEMRLGTDALEKTIINGTDTDRDGFSDRLEIELGSNWLDSKKIIDLKEYYSISAQEKQLLALVETHTEKGEFLGVQGMEMNAKVENNQLVYTPNASPLNLGITQDTEWKAFLQSGKNIIQGDSQNNVLEAKGEMQILYGASGNDILKTSTGVDILVGGSGQDTFVLTEESIKSGKMDFISDFAAEDKLNLSALKSIFNINHLNLKWSDLLTTQAQDNDALVWNEQEHTLSYQSKGSQNVHVLAKFDDDVDMARISAGLIG